MKPQPNRRRIWLLTGLLCIIESPSSCCAFELSTVLRQIGSDHLRFFFNLACVKTLLRNLCVQIFFAIAPQVSEILAGNDFTRFSHSKHGSTSFGYNFFVVWHRTKIKTVLKTLCMGDFIPEKKFWKIYFLTPFFPHFTSSHKM